MMSHAPALKVAIDLVHFPSQVRPIRSAPLPDDVLILLRIAAGEEEAISQAIEWTGRSRETVHEASGFFIEQILFYPDADSYRVLGARPEASHAELRRNVALLLRWLHPDLDRQGERSVFAGRVTRAWNDLKTEERRAAYDRLKRMSLAEKSVLRKKSRARAEPKKHALNQSNRSHKHGPYGRPTGFRRSLDFDPVERRGFLHRILLLFFGRAAH
jgi:hypothetical protein